jgi:hypothetical protein
MRLTCSRCGAGGSLAKRTSAVKCISIEARVQTTKALRTKHVAFGTQLAFRDQQEGEGRDRAVAAGVMQDAGSIVNGQRHT